MGRTFLVFFLAVAMQGALYTLAEKNSFPRLRKVTQEDVRLNSMDFLMKNNARWWLPFDNPKAAATPSKADVVYITVPTTGNVNAGTTRKGGADSTFRYVPKRQHTGAKREKYFESEFLQYPQFVSILPGPPVFLAVPGWTGHPPPPFIPHNHQTDSWPNKRQRPLLIEPPMDEPIGISLPGTPTATTDDETDDFFNKRITGLDNRGRPRPSKRPTKRPTKKPAKRPTTTTPKPDSIQEEFDNFLLANRKKKPRPSRKPKPSRKPTQSTATPEPDSAEEDLSQEAMLGKPVMMITAGGGDSLANRKKKPRPSRKPRPSKKPKPSRKPTQSPATPEPDSGEEDLSQEAMLGKPVMMITAGGGDSLANRKKKPRPSRKPKPSRKPSTTKKPALVLPTSETPEALAMDDAYEPAPSSLEEATSHELSSEDVSSSEDESYYPIEVPSEANLENKRKPKTTTTARPEIVTGSQSMLDGVEDEYMGEPIQLEPNAEKPSALGRPRPSNKPTTTPKPSSEVDDSLRPDPVVKNEFEESNYGYGAIRIEAPRPSVPQMVGEVAIETEGDTVTVQEPMNAGVTPSDVTPDSTESLGPDDTLITVRRNGKPMQLRLDQVKPWELFKLPSDSNWQRSLQRVQGHNYFFAS